MNSKILIALAFFLVAAAQIYIPAEMINGREAVIANGRMFRFRTEPVDPADLLRGRFISLYFPNSYIQFAGDSSYTNEQYAYVLFGEDSEGLAKIKGISKEKPGEAHDYLKVRITTHYQNDTTTIYFEYPFDRYYMEEYKAPKAEELYMDSIRDTLATTYAVVMIKDGEGVLTDVMINERPISELVEELTK